MSVSLESTSETIPDPDWFMDRFCSLTRCPAPSRVVVFVGAGEVYLCGHHTRDMYKELIYPAFWKGTDVPVDADNFWGPPAPPEPVESDEPVIEEDDDDEEDMEDEDD